MHNPKNFTNPEKFDPERFLDENGRFQTDARVCPFSVGFRNCIGMQLAQEWSIVIEKKLICFRNFFITVNFDF